MGELEERWGEVQRGVGLKGGTALYELWVSAETGTWTMIVTRPDGLACVLADGRHWSEREAVAPALGQES